MRAAIAVGCCVIFTLGLVWSDASASVPSCESTSSREFRRYDLGNRFRSLVAVRKFRRCDAPYPGESVRANFFERQYARCGDCDVIVSVQSWPACERSRADVTDPPPGGLPSPEVRHLQLRDVPALYFVADRRLELYTGRTTVVLFGPNLVTLRRATYKLRTSRGMRPKVGPRDRLPAPVPGALAGQLRCPKED